MKMPNPAAALRRSPYFLLLLATLLGGCGQPVTEREANGASIPELVTAAKGEDAGRIEVADAGVADAGGPHFCSSEVQHCVVRNDCCNSRHSCVAGICQY